LSFRENWVSFGLWHPTSRRPVIIQS
jgi:hypothetical protein